MLPRPAYGVLLLWVWVTSYLAVRAVEGGNATPRRVWVGALMVMLPMLTLKFTAPIIDNFFPHMLKHGIPGVNAVFPIGLSCYTLQAVSLVIDVYKRRTRRDPSLINHALYVSFLPTVSSGPIQLSTHLMKQIGRNHKLPFKYSLAIAGTKRIIWGLFMKVAVADRIGIYVNSVLQHSEQYNSPTVLIALVCYTMQIYCDFAGYSHMAIGTANVLGYTLPDNFKRPLLAMGLKQLWTRWHISLGSWLRDYVYFPLGGSRCSRRRMITNLLFTFAMSGMWHGVRLSYLCWGMGNGLMVTLDHFLPLDRWRKMPIARVAWSLISVIMLSVLWAFFRDDVNESLRILNTLFTGGFAGGWIITDRLHTIATLTAMAAGMAVVAARDISLEYFSHRLAAWHTARKAITFVFYVSLIIVVLLFGVMGTGQFIYQRF